MDITLAIIEFMRFLRMHSNYLIGPFSWYNIVYCIGLLIEPTGQDLTVKFLQILITRRNYP